MGDNKQKAEWLLKRSIHYREQGAIDLAKATAIAAQAEATLELAEQQRIANLMEFVRSAAGGPAAQSGDPEVLAYLEGITQQIRDGLGIEPGEEAERG